MPLELITQKPVDPESDEPLAMNEALVADWLTEFIHDELVRRRGFQKCVVGVSGGVDSALVAYLCARAIGPENVYGIRMPYCTSSPDSLAHGADGD